MTDAVVLYLLVQLPKSKERIVYNHWYFIPFFSSFPFSTIGPLGAVSAIAVWSETFMIDISSTAYYLDEIVTLELYDYIWHFAQYLVIHIFLFCFL